ncbi:MAG: hypothetical protein WBE15_14860 [Candidatus Cybelea sp.]
MRLAFVALALGTTLTSCASPPSVTPPLSVRLGSATARFGFAEVGHVDRAASWMAPLAESKKLLYVSDIGAEDVYAFSYPDGVLMGTLTGFIEPNGLCVDKKGDVYVSDTYAGELLEYAHGRSKPIRKIKDPGNPLGCSVDPLTGNLATSHANGTFAIFTEAKGKPQVIVGGRVLHEGMFCGYDDKGNLFADGQNSYGLIQLGEIPKGGNGPSAISVNLKMGWPGGVQWVGHDVAVGDQFADKFNPSQDVNAIYRFKVSGTTGTLLSTAELNGGGDVVQFWIEGANAIGPDAQNEDVAFWKFPGGGNALKMVNYNFYEPVGATVSNPK